MTAIATNPTESQPTSAPSAHPPSQARVRTLAPRVDVFENSEELLLVADVPGATPQSVHIRLEDGALSLGAEYARADGLSVRYQRGFQVPDTVDADQITAQLKDGVLHVHLRKLEKAKPRTIAVTAN